MALVKYQDGIYSRTVTTGPGVEQLRRSRPMRYTIKPSSHLTHCYLNIYPQGDLDLRAFDLETGALYCTLPRPAYGFVTYVTRGSALERERERERERLQYSHGHSIAFNVVFFLNLHILNNFTSPQPICNHNF